MSELSTTVNRCTHLCIPDSTHKVSSSLPNNGSWTHSVCLLALPRNVSCATLRLEIFVWSGDGVMGSSPFLPLPSTLSIDAVEHHSQTVVVHLSATSPTAPCPRCGTPGSRVHSRYSRTIADLPCVGQRLVLKLLVRKWVCPASSCSQRIFAERFPGLVQS